MAAQRIPAIRAAVQIMRDEGVEIAFGCPGAALLPLYAAMEEAGGIEHLPVRHEEAAAHMADGWARTSGKVGVAAVAAGPGAARLVTGLYAAQQDAVPLVCLTGREGAVPGTGGRLRHAGFRPPDLLRLAGAVTKRAERIEDPARIPGAFREAFRIARDGRPGPVLIDVPADLAAAEIVYDAERTAESGFRPPQAGTRRAAAERAAPAGDTRPAPAAVAEIAEAFGPDAYVVSGAVGAYARSGPPGWEVPAAIGVRKALDSRGERDAEVVVVVDGHGWPFMAEELAAAAQHEVPFVLITLTPPGQDTDFTDPVKLVEAYGCAGRHLAGPADPAELRSVTEWARKEAVSTRRPVLIEVRPV
ncbi:thiamine pyrophosphate-binding protein [Streptomyces sp. MOE7]|uniref:thiamine pyrophosphate-binding protein n=1 Tax=Streptomyces sp. MOE7 TaxID=1961713 RepID=UPI001F28397D|nr:thiamine pyrophosphate-binding protein [Streptomyces sp. MOE7]